jgi:tRNA(Ser,Leu) C12 N-acetylase TAN1
MGEKKERAVAAALGRSESQRILEAIAETVLVAPASLPAAALSAARRSEIEKRLEEIEATKNLSDKDFSVLINARG